MADYIILFLSVMCSVFITYKVSYKRGYERGDHNGFTRGLWKGYDAEKRRLDRTEANRKKPTKKTEDFAWLD